jgi:hypothetical protein
MWRKSWQITEHLASCSCLVITTNLSEFHHGTWKRNFWFFSIGKLFSYTHIKAIRGTSYSNFGSKYYSNYPYSNPKKNYGPESEQKCLDLQYRDRCFLIRIRMESGQKNSDPHWNDSKNSESNLFHELKLLLHRHARVSSVHATVSTICQRATGTATLCSFQLKWFWNRRTHRKMLLSGC